MSALAVATFVLSIVLYFIFCSGWIWFGTREGVRKAKFGNWLVCLLVSLIIVAGVKKLVGTVLSAVAALVLGIIKAILFILLLVILIAAIYYGYSALKEIKNRRKKTELNSKTVNDFENRSYTCANCGYVFSEGIFCPECGTKMENELDVESNTDPDGESNGSGELKRNFITGATDSQLYIYIGAAPLVIIACIFLMCGVINIGKNKADKETQTDKVTYDDYADFEYNDSSNSSYDDFEGNDQNTGYSDSQNSNVIDSMYIDDAKEESTDLLENDITDYALYEGYIDLAVSLDGYSSEYGICDIDGDGIMEMIISYGTCNADWQNDVYTIVNDNVIYIGTFYGVVNLYYSDRQVTNDGMGIISVYGNQGYETINQITKKGEELFSVEVISRDIGFNDYYGNELMIPLYDTKDKSALYGMMNTEGLDKGGSQGNDGDYLLPESDSHYLTVDDLKGLNKSELRIARNEIYARHGRRFKDEELQSYFENKEWYVGIYSAEEFSEDLLSEIEKYNRDFIVEYEKGVN